MLALRTAQALGGNLWVRGANILPLARLSCHTTQQQLTSCADIVCLVDFFWQTHWSCGAGMRMEEVLHDGAAMIPICNDVTPLLSDDLSLAQDRGNLGDSN